MMLLSRTSPYAAPNTRGRVAQAPTALPAAAAVSQRSCASRQCLNQQRFQSAPSVISRRKIVARFEGSAEAPQSSKVAEDEATVEEIMQPHPIVLTADMTCHDAARLLLKNDISSAPVVDGSGKLVGVLSESDLLWKSAGPLDHTIIPPVFVGAFDLLISLQDNNAVKAELDKILAQTVGQAMSKEPKTVTLSTSLSQAARTLLQAKVHLLPVVDDQNKVVGVLTQHDILRGMVAEQDL